MPPMFPRHANYKECFCAMQDDVRYNGRSIEGSRRPIQAAAGALHLPPEFSRRTHRIQDYRAPQQHVRRALEVLLMASRRTWLLFPNTHKEKALRAPREMMPTLVTSKLLYNEAGARCISPSLSRGPGCAMHLAQLEPGPYTYRRSSHIARTTAKTAALCAANALGVR